MNIEELLKQARATWPHRMTEEQVLAALMTVVGDIARLQRDKSEGKVTDEAELQKELGNIIFSTIRWCDDLGYDPAACIQLAEAAQRQYVQNQQNQSKAM